MDILVSGRGIVSSLGVGIENNWQAASNGRSGISFDNPLSALLGQPVPLGHVRGFADRDRLYDIAKEAFEECVRSASLAAHDLERTALVFAQSGPDYDLIHTEAQRILGAGRSRPDTVYRTMISYVGAKLGRRYKLRAPVVSTSAACSGSGLALHMGVALIASGAVDRCICGGAEIISSWMFRAFESMKAVLSSGDRPDNLLYPYGAARSGIVLGEGAGFLLLENHRSAAARKAPAYARLVASRYENVADATWGDIPDKAIWKDILEATAGGDRPDYLLGHGTSTPHGDAVEGAALQDLYPGTATASLKPYFGHTLAASTVLDAVLLTACFEHQQVLGVGADYELAPELQDLRVVRGTTHQRVSRALKLTAGFGGSMSCLQFATA